MTRAPILMCALLIELSAAGPLRRAQKLRDSSAVAAMQVPLQVRWIHVSSHKRINCRKFRCLIL